MVGLPGPAVVAVLTRAPSRGGKTRLFTALGRGADPALLAALLLDTLDGVAVPGTTRVVFVEPADACRDVRALVARDVDVRPQSSGTLGDRMRAAMQAVLAGGAGAVVLVGSDLPDITPAIVANAIAYLTHDRESLVLGPARDGGYYLIAATSVPDVFDGIEWGSPHVLAQTRSAAAAAGLRIRLLPPLRDIDSPEDLRAVVAPRTRAWVVDTLVMPEPPR